MSKITKALEKAARERRWREQTLAAASVSAPQTVASTPDVNESVLARTDSTVDAHIVSLADSGSPIAEQYRILRANLQSVKWGPGAKVFTVTSALNGEGKSVTAVNLALTWARQEQMRVVLVDADLRKGSVHRWLGLEASREGLSTVLQRDGHLNGALIKLSSVPLTVLLAGPETEHPAELLESSGMKRVLATLKAQFDVIIIDTPPVLPVADPGIIAAQTDGAVFVVRAGRTQRKTALQAHALLTQMNATVLGCVLTHVEHYLAGYYGYYRYHRYGSTPEDAPAPSEEARPQASATVAT